jgi:hypothetical protein
LFPVAPAATEVLPLFRFSWVPAATALLALMCVLVNQRQGFRFAGSGGVGPMVAMIMSNQSAAAYLPGSFQAEQNNLPADAFRWAGSQRFSHDAILPSRPTNRRQP